MMVKAIFAASKLQAILVPSTVSFIITIWEANIIMVFILLFLGALNNIIFELKGLFRYRWVDWKWER